MRLAPEKRRDNCQTDQGCANNPSGPPRSPPWRSFLNRRRQLFREILGRFRKRCQVLYRGYKSVATLGNGLDIAEILHPIPKRLAQRGDVSSQRAFLNKRIRPYALNDFVLF